MEGVEWVWDNGVLKAQDLQRIKEQVENDTRSRVDREQRALRAFNSFINKL